MSESELYSLIQLIDDPDEQVYSAVKDRLMELGVDVVPQLEVFWESNDYGLIFQHRIEQIIHEIQFDAIHSKLKEWKSSSDKDLLHGAIIVAQYQYPDLDVDAIYREVERIRQDAWLEINESLTSYETVKVLNHVFFDLHKFRADRKNFHSTSNSLINDVLHNRRGNPLSLALIYSIVAQQLNIPIYGVNLPNHFILAYMDEFQTMQFVAPEVDSMGILFYINVFNKGALFDKNEISDFLKQLKLEPQRHYFEPCSNSAIIKRMLTNLKYSFAKQGIEEKTAEIDILLQVFS